MNDSRSSRWPQPVSPAHVHFCFVFLEFFFVPFLVVAPVIKVAGLSLRCWIRISRSWVFVVSRRNQIICWSPGFLCYTAALQAGLPLAACRKPISRNIYFSVQQTQEIPKAGSLTATPCCAVCNVGGLSAGKLLFFNFQQPKVSFWLEHYDWRNSKEIQLKINGTLEFEQIWSVSRFDSAEFNGQVEILKRNSLKRLT